MNRAQYIRQMITEVNDSRVFSVSKEPTEVKPWQPKEVSKDRVTPTTPSYVRHDDYEYRLRNLTGKP